MLIEGKGWHGRVKDDPRGEFSFGPSTRARARAAVEAWLRHEPIEFQGDERAWRGTCDQLVNLKRPGRIAREPGKEERFRSSSDVEGAASDDMADLVGVDGGGV